MAEYSNIVRKAWNILEKDDKRSALMVAGFIMFGALFSAVAVVSIFPFLAILADRSQIHENEMFNTVYRYFGFTSDYSFLIFVGAASILTIILGNAIQIAKSYIIVRFSSLQTHRISTRLLNIYLRQPYQFFLYRHSGDMGKNILSETSQLVSQFYRPIAEIAASLLTSMAVIGAVILIEPVVAMVAIAGLGGIYVVLFTFTKRYLRRSGEERLQLNTTRFKIAGESFSGIKEIKILSREGNYIDRFVAASLRMANMQIIVSIISSMPQFIVQSLAYVGIIVLCLTMVDQTAYESGLALGGILPTIGVFAFAAQRVLPELSRLYGSFSKIQYGLAVVHNIEKDFRLHSGTMEQGSSGGERLPFRKSLVLSDVSYNYKGSDTAGVRGLSLEITAGQRVGVIGGTGAGKTTFADMVLGLLHHQSGEIAVDGVPLVPGNLEAWRQSVAYVPQDIFLADTTIEENIVLGTPAGEIDAQKVRKCAQMAQLDGFITGQLPEGYDTMVGERGVRLSGGQRQRIGIARALYREADIIVFDEATSALDTVTEREVMEAIDNLPGNKTIIIIAHRLSTVQSCDRIMVMQTGELAGFGTWDDLAASNAAFKALAVQ